MTFQPKPLEHLNWVCVDFDDTLAKAVWPEPGIGDPIWPNVAKLLGAVKAGYSPVIHTSRMWGAHTEIQQWLRHHKIEECIGVEPGSIQIVCGKPLAALYIDDRARHADDPSWLPDQRQGEGTAVHEPEPEFVDIVDGNGTVVSRRADLRRCHAVLTGLDQHATRYQALVVDGLLYCNRPDHWECRDG